MKEDSNKASDNFSMAVTYKDPPKDGKRRFVKDSPAYKWEESFKSNEQGIVESLNANFYEVLVDGGEYVAIRIKGLDVGWPSKFVVRASPFKSGITCCGEALNLDRGYMLQEAIRIVSNLDDIYACGRYGLKRKVELEFNPPRRLGAGGYSLESLGSELQSYGYQTESLELDGEGSVGKRHVAKFNYWDRNIVSAFDEQNALGSNCAGIKVSFKR
jgi:hypothetical protein